jgi:hypothetical protein
MEQPRLPLSASSPVEVRFFRDLCGTLFAAQIVERDYWDDLLRAPLGVDEADVRVVFLQSGSAPRGLPPWIGVCASRPPETDEAWLVALAQALWLRSPFHREEGPQPEAYVTAAFHALCPPHPPCDLGPHARGTVVEFLRGRAEPLGRLAEEGDDGFDRWLRACWPTPEALARDILLERMLDEDALEQVAAIRRVERAEVEAGSEFDMLARERDALLPRLDPLRYFTQGADFDAAIAEAEAWWRRYVDAYAAHCRRLSAMAAVLPSELLAAITVAELLRSLNQSPRRGAPVGEEALDRLQAAVDEIRGIEPSPPVFPVPGIVLGRVPSAFAEARLAAAAVLAAVDVHRRRAPL